VLMQEPKALLNERGRGHRWKGFRVHGALSKLGFGKSLPEALSAREGVQIPEHGEREMPGGCLRVAISGGNSVSRPEGSIGWKARRRLQLPSGGIRGAGRGGENP